MLSPIANTLSFITTNNGKLSYEHFLPEAHADIATLIERGKVEVKDGKLFTMPTKPNDMTATTTTKAPVVTMETLVSVRIGSDVYQAKVLRVTAATVTVAYGTRYGSELTFRPTATGRWCASESFFLVVGKSETVLDPSF